MRREKQENLNMTNSVVYETKPIKRRIVVAQVSEFLRPHNAVLRENRASSLEIRCTTYTQCWGTPPRSAVHRCHWWLRRCTGPSHQRWRGWRWGSHRVGRWPWFPGSSPPWRGRPRGTTSLWHCRAALWPRTRTGPSHPRVWSGWWAAPWWRHPLRSDGTLSGALVESGGVLRGMQN